MSKPAQAPTPQEAQDHIRSLLRVNGLPEPDEVEHDPEPQELICLWHQRKLAVVIELTDGGPADVSPGERREGR